MTKYSKGEWTNARYDICEIECDGEVYCTVATKDVELIIDVLNENEQLKKELFETSTELLWATSDEVDRVLYYEEEVEELRKEIFE